MKYASTAREKFIALRFTFRLRNTSHERTLHSNARVLHIAYAMLHNILNYFLSYILMKGDYNYNGK